MTAQGRGKERRAEILAISSGGGHWEQMMRLRPSFEGFQVAYAGVKTKRPREIGDSPFYAIPDGNRWTVLRLIWMLMRVYAVIRRVKPKIVISTGAAPGYFALRIAKRLGAGTVWIDSIANSRELSLSGRKVGRYADLYLTQWPQLTRPQGPHYAGNVLAGTAPVKHTAV